MDENMSEKYEIEDVRRRPNIEHVLVNSVYRANSRIVSSVNDKIGTSPTYASWHSGHANMKSLGKEW